MNIWLQTGRWMNQGTNIYLPNDHIGYPPLWAFWCLASYGVYGFLGQNLEAWRFTVKLPLILAQFGLAFAIWKFGSQKFDAGTAKKVFLFTLTCSFFVYIGAFWGQINMLSALLTFLAFYAVTSKRSVVGGFLLGLAVALKTYPLIALPAFLIFLLKNKEKKEGGKFLLCSFAVPVGLTLVVFTAYNWDITYLLRTMLYWAPVYDATPLQYQGGCMNIWSFAGLMGLDIATTAVLRFLWIPVMIGIAVFWWQKKTITEADLSLSIVSFYLLFMVSYVWVAEQTFLDPMPFILLSILAYRPKRSYIYALAGIQLLVYFFTFFNGGPLIFEPLFAKVYPPLIPPVVALRNQYGIISWQIRGATGLAISISLIGFLAYLAEPNIIQKSQQKIKMLQAKWRL